MAHYSVNTDQGLAEFDYPGPALNRDQIEQVLNDNAGSSAEAQPQAPATPVSNLERMKQMASQGNYGKAAFAALAMPEEFSKQGLRQLTDLGSQAQNAIASKTGLPIGTAPTGNMARDIAANIPRIAGETIAEAAPGFISRGALLTAGALKGAQAVSPLVKLGLRAVAGAGESMSGAPAGLAEASYNDSSIFLGKGKKAVQATYEAAKAGDTIAPELAAEAQKIDFVKKASDLADNGQLNPTEALEARKELDGIRKKVTNTFYQTTRDKLDLIAKQSFEGADAEYKKAIYSEAARKLAPQNKYGGASPFRIAVGEALSKMGIPVSAVAGMLSPAAQAATATGAGLVGRNVISPLVNNPALGVTIQQLMQTLKEKGINDPLTNALVLGQQSRGR